MYFIIEGKTPHTHNGQPVIKNGNQLFYTSFVLTRDSESNCDEKAKRFKTAEDAQKYIDRWLQSREATYKPVVREDWK